MKWVPVLRPVAPADSGFLLQVYASTRAAELALTGWDAATCAAFVRQQFEAQQVHYLRHWPASEHSIIQVMAEGQPQPVGRLWVDWRPDALHVLDITLLPAWCGQGIGATCLRRLQRSAAGRGLALGIHVEQGNPARHLYDRLGFVPVGTLQGIHQLMRWQPEPDAAASNTQEACSEQA